MLFKDSSGREWNVVLTFGDTLRTKAMTGKSLDDFIPKFRSKDDKAFVPLQDFFTDHSAIFDFFWAIIKPAADQLAITKDQFAETGLATLESVVEMREAVLDAIANFIQSLDPERAMNLRKTVTTAAMLGEKTAARMGSQIEKLNLDAVADELPQITTEKVCEAIRSQQSNAAGSLAAG